MTNPVDSKVNSLPAKHTEPNKKALILTSAATGAILGAAVGVAFGPVGILAGAVAGAVVGVFTALATFAINAMMDRFQAMQNPSQGNQRECAVNQAITWLQEPVSRLHTEGIFRTCGLKDKIDEISRNAENDIVLDCDKYGVENVAGFIKQQFRERNIRIFPETFSQEQFNDLTNLIQKANSNETPHEEKIAAKVEATKKLKNLLKSQGTCVKKYILLLNEVSKHSKDNKMTVDNLAIVLNPSLVPNPIYLDTTIANFLIENAPEIYSSSNEHTLIDQITLDPSEKRLNELREEFIKDKSLSAAQKEALIYAHARITGAPVRFF